MVRVFEYAFGTDPGNIPEKVIVTPFYPEKYFTDLWGGSSCFNTGKLFRFRSFESKDGSVGFLRLGRSSYLAGDAVIMLGHAGVKKMLFLNSCAYVGKDCVGDIILTDKCLALDSFGLWHSSGPDHERLLSSADILESDQDMRADFLKMVKQRNDFTETREGPNLTIGSILAETDGLAGRLLDKKVLSIDMELSKVLTAAAVSGIKAVSAMVVSDSLMGRKFYHKMQRPECSAFNAGCRLLSGAALDFFIGPQKREV